MLSKKILFLITAENEIKALTQFGKKFKEKYDVQMDVIYVKDVLKYEVFPVAVEGIGVNVGMNYFVREYKEQEEKVFQKIKSQIDDSFGKVYAKEGETDEIALEELKKYDALVLVKNEKVSPVLKELLRSNYKPLIILPNVEEFEMENILLLDDGAYNANKTLFTFLYMFGEQKVNVLRVNSDLEKEEDGLAQRFGENYNLIYKKGETFKTLLKETENYDFILMGDLRYTIMVEKITGKLGIRLLENVKKPVFIV